MLNQEDKLDLAFHALAAPVRRGIVSRLSRGPASISELAAPFAVSLPAIVQHIQILETSGLVRTKKVGRVRTCHIQPAVLKSAEDWIAKRRSTWERRLDSLAKFLGEKND
jgi:DNA-binding transcriptional ArsR family regulator